MIIIICPAPRGQCDGLLVWDSQVIHPLRHGRGDPGWTVGPLLLVGSALLFNFFPVNFLFSYSLLSFHSTSLFFDFFFSCCSHARVFGKALVNEFHISYSHSEQCLFFGYFVRQCNSKCTRCVTVSSLQLQLYGFGVYNLPNYIWQTKKLKKIGING